jgi:inner membrane protein
MQGPSHLAISWAFGEALGLQSARERRIVAWAGLAPDIDVVAYVAAIVYYGFDQERAFENVWQVIHHRYTHGLGFVVLTGIVAYALSSRWRIALLAILASAIHNFCDLVGGGPTWPIYPLWPLTDAAWSASWSWTIGEWPNIVILFVCLAGTLVYARLHGRSPMECFGDRADAWLVRVVRNEQRESRPGGNTRLRLIIWGALIVATLAILAPLGFKVPL